MQFYKQSDKIRELKFVIILDYLSEIQLIQNNLDILFSSYKMAGLLKSD